MTDGFMDDPLLHMLATVEACECGRSWGDHEAATLMSIEDDSASVSILSVRGEATLYLAVRSGVDDVLVDDGEVSFGVALPLEGARELSTVLGLWAKLITPEEREELLRRLSANGTATLESHANHDEGETS